MTSCGSPGCSEDAALRGTRQALRRWWWLVGIATVLACVVAYVVALQQTPQYEARVKLLVGPIAAPDLDSQRAAGQVARTYSELVASRPIVEATAGELGIPVDRVRLQATANDVTRLLTIYARAPTAAGATALANAAAEQIADVATGTGPGSSVSVVDPATVPTGAVSPRIPLVVLLGALAGLVGSIAVVMLVEQFRRTVATEKELEAAAGVPCLGKVKRTSAPYAHNAVSAFGTSPSFLLVATELRFAHDDREPLRSLLVVGASGLEAADEVAVGLSTVIASSGKRVTLIAADPASDAVSRLLSDRHRVRRDPANLQRVRSLENLSVVRLGPAEREPGRIASTLDAAAVHSDLVIVHSQPVGIDPAMLAWARATQATLVVATSESTTRESVAHTMQALKVAEAHAVGSVLVERAGTLKPGARMRESWATSRAPVSPLSDEPPTGAVAASPAASPSGSSHHAAGGSSTFAERHGRR